LFNQREQQMLHVDLLLAAPDRLRLRRLHAFLELFGKSIEVHGPFDL
jgi:hypothetical protein